MRPPWRFETKRRSDSHKKQSIARDEYSQLEECSLDPRSTFDLVMTGQMQIFWEIEVFFFSTIQDNSDRVMANIAMKPLPSCLVDNWYHFSI